MTQQNISNLPPVFMKQPLHVEVVVRNGFAKSICELRLAWEDYLKSLDGTANHTRFLRSFGEIDLSILPTSIQQSCVRACLVAEDDTEEEEYAESSSLLPSTSSSIMIHTFVMSQEEVTTEELETVGEDNEWTAACDTLKLPHISLDGSWETLIFDKGVKRQLLNYAQSALLFSERKVSSHLVQWNRILLLHGVPGTGKTTLCRALAHKLAIRLSHRFSRATLLEVHSHSLFSKWFSTSGKLVSALFEMIRDMAEDDPSCLLVVLIDEVESLASSRSSNASSGDPSDAMRAVNSLLTSLDRLRSLPNILILCTTNLTRSIDTAFMDRADLKIGINLPVLNARYQILRSCLEELIRAGIVQHDTHSPFTSTPYNGLDKENERESFLINGGISLNTNKIYLSKMLTECAKQAEGLSGRSLRKLPLQAHSYFFSICYNEKLIKRAVTPENFLMALSRAIQEEQNSRREIQYQCYS